MHTTPKAMEIENETLKNIVDSFFNENSKFLKNLDSVKGIFYNPISHDEIYKDSKELQILAQATEITDPRFVIAKDAQKLHLKINNNPEKINVTHTSIIKDITNDDWDYITSSYSYINAKDVPEILKTKPIQFTPEERHKILKNLEKRVLECNKDTRITYVLPNEAYKIPEKDRQKSFMLMDASSQLLELMDQDKKISSNKKSIYAEMTVTPRANSNSEEEVNEFITREIFKCALSASLLARELGENPPLKYILRDQEFNDNLFKTYCESENGTEKLIDDINRAEFTKTGLTIFILDKEKVRKSKEKIKAMEENYKKNPSGKELSPEDYYTYKSLDIEPFVIKMDNDKAIKTEIDKEIEEKEKNFTEKMKSMGKKLNPQKIRRAIKKMVRSSIGKNTRLELFKRGITSPALTTVSRDMTKNAQKQKTHKKAHSRDTGRE